MQKFLIKIWLFSVSCFLLISLADFALPFYWGNELWTAKMAWLKENPNKYNTLFLGSSRTNLQVIPPVFDSETNGLTRSFNLSSDGALFEENFYFLNHLLESEEDISGIKTIFFEINDVGEIKDSDMHSVRKAYSTDWKTFRFTDQYFGLFLDSLNQKRQSQFRQLFIQNCLKTGMISEMFEAFSNKESHHRNEWTEGAFPKYLNDGKPIWTSRKAFLKDTIYVKNYLPKLKKIFAETENKKPNPQVRFLIGHYNRLIAKAEKKGIQLIFFNALPNIYNAKRRKIICDNIKKGHALNLENPFEFPGIFNRKLFWDTHHLNGTGAEIFTKKLAEMYLNSEISE